jgi:hypothetical protein
MYWLTTTTTDPFDSSAGEPKGLGFAKEVEAAALKAFDPTRIEKFFLTLEEDTKKLNLKVANGLSSNLASIQSVIYDVYKEGLDYGFAYGDAKDYIEAIQAGGQKMTSITKDNTKEALIMGAALGVGAKEVGALYSNFLQFGMSQETANAKLTTIMQTARKYGVDASVLTKTVSDKIYQAQLYGFKNGIEGLTKMAIQAQRVGTSMDLAAKAADKAFNPEEAIEMASTMQMLGGSVGALADPFQLMNMAQSDMGALQDQILKSSASMVDFNTKTGEFKISPEMRRNMTEFAKSIGSDYETVAKSAVKFRKEQEVMSRIPLTAGFSEEDKSIITSMAEIGPGGQVQIKDPKTDKMVDVANLTSQQITDLKAFQKEANRTPEEVAKQQLSTQDKMAKTLEEIKNAGIFGVGKEKGMEIPTILNDKMINAAQIFSDTLVSKMSTSSPNIGDSIISAYNATVTTLSNVIVNTTNNIGDMIDDLITASNKIAKATVTDSDGDGIPNDTDPDDDNNPSTPDDFFLPSDSRTMITADFGGMVKKIIPNNDDTLLGMPKESMESLFKYANLGGEVSTMVPKEKNFEKNVQTLSQYVEQKIVTENTSNVKLGVEPISVNVKLEGTGLNKDEISKLVDTNEINNAVIERLRGIFDETKLINSIPQLKL